MGHKTLAMTERYSHLIHDHKRDAVKGLARTFEDAQLQNREQVVDMKNSQ
jgi:hypothetical protein